MWRSGLATRSTAWAAVYHHNCTCTGPPGRVDVAKRTIYRHNCTSTQCSRRVDVAKRAGDTVYGMGGGLPPQLHMYWASRASGCCKEDDIAPQLHIYPVFGASECAVVATGDSRAGGSGCLCRPRTPAAAPAHEATPGPRGPHRPGPAWTGIVRRQGPAGTLRWVGVGSSIGADTEGLWDRRKDQRATTVDARQ
jgi:hypothetical protein